MPIVQQNPRPVSVPYDLIIPWNSIVAIGPFGKGQPTNVDCSDTAVCGTASEGFGCAYPRSRRVWRERGKGRRRGWHVPSRSCLLPEEVVTQLHRAGSAPAYNKHNAPPPPPRPSPTPLIHHLSPHRCQDKIDLWPSSEPFLHLCSILLLKKVTRTHPPKYGGPAVSPQRQEVDAASGSLREQRVRQI